MTILDFFYRNVKKFPQKIAVVNTNESINYAALDLKSDLFAQYLIDKGVTSHSIVSFYLEKSITAVIVILAILKTGASYLPLDTEQPVEILQSIISDSQCQFIVSDTSLQEKLNSIPCKKIFYNEEQKFFQKKLVFDFRKRELLDPKASAYIIYTSGTTASQKMKKLLRIWQ